MAFQNILQSKFTGKLGELSGSTWKGKAIVKSAPFSQKPHSNAQTQSVRAFECSNRLCSGIAKAGFHKLGLSSKNMHPHNAVAKWLKPIVKNHVFEPQNIREVIPPSNNFLVTGFTYNRSTGEMIIAVKKSDSYTLKDFENLFVVIFNNMGKVAHAMCVQSPSYTATLKLDPSHNFVYSLILFSTYPQGNKYIAHNFFYKRGTGMKYSFEEQLTGDLWLDGRPIYQVSIRATYPGIPADVADTALELYTPYQMNLIKTEQILLSNTGGSVTASPTFQATSQSSILPLIHINVCYIPSENKLYLRRSRANPAQQIAVNATPIILTLFYTKPSDQPVVDG